MGINVPSFSIFFTQISLVDLISFLIFVGASLTDYFDGYLARKHNLVTTFGKFVDPVADKLIVNSALIMLTCAGKMPVICLLIMILRDTIVDAIRFVAASNNIVLAASTLGKAKTMTQMIAISLLLLDNPFFTGVGISFDIFMIYLATAISATSGIDYYIKNAKYITETM